MSPLDPINYVVVQSWLVHSQKFP